MRQHAMRQKGNEMTPTLLKHHFRSEGIKEIKSKFEMEDQNSIHKTEFIEKSLLRCFLVRPRMIYAPVAGKRPITKQSGSSLRTRRFLVKAHKFVMAHFHFTFPQNPFTQNGGR